MITKRVVVVVKWSACLPSTPIIRVRILLKFVFEKNESNKEAGVGHFFKKRILSYFENFKNPINCNHEQCDQIWRNLATLIKCLGNSGAFICYLAKLWAYIANFNVNGEIFIVVNGQMMKMKMAIWSHWLYEIIIDFFLLMLTVR